MKIEEIWKDIEGFEGYYQVSNLGNVKSLDRVCWNGRYYYPVKSCMLTPTITEGYLNVQLRKDGKRKFISVHRLVALTFILNPNNYRVVNHKDEIKTNNRVDNLEWCTDKYNVNYGNAQNKRVSNMDFKHIAEINKIKNSKKVYQYDTNKNLIRTWVSTKECDDNGFCRVCISNCCLNKQKIHRGFIWSYKPLEINN